MMDQHPSTFMGAGAEQEQNIRGGQIKNLQLLLLKS